MSRKKWELDRRTFLRGMGVSLALPMLECMLPSVARAANGKVQRYMSIYIPNGMQMDGTDLRPPQHIMSVLNQVRSDITVVSGLKNSNSSADTGGNAHNSVFFPFYTGNTRAGTPRDLTATYDQLIARLNKGLKMDAVSINLLKKTQVDANPFLINYPSYTGTDMPVPIWEDPKTLFDQLFTGAVQQPQIDQREQDRLKNRRGILHYITQDISRVKSRIGRSDQNRLDEYLTGINELDRKIATQIVDPGNQPAPTTCQGPSGIVSTSDYATKMRLFYDIVFYAFKCDQTRVVSVMHAWEGNHLVHRPFVSGMQSNASWHSLHHWNGGIAEIGKNTGYDDLSRDPQFNLAEFRRVTAWHHQQVVNFVKRLKAEVQPNGLSLLDESIIAWGSSMSVTEGIQGRGDVHDPNGVMITLAGSGNGAFKKQADVHLNNSTPVANLWLTLMQGFGVTANSYGNSSGNIPSIRT